MAANSTPKPGKIVVFVFDETSRGIKNPVENAKIEVFKNGQDEPGLVNVVLGQILSPPDGFPVVHWARPPIPDGERRSDP